MSEPSGPRDSDVYSRVWRGWDAYFATVWLGTVVFVLGGMSVAPLAVRITACAVFTLLVPWYLWAGRPVLLSLGEDRRLAARYMAVAVLIFVPATVLAPETRLASFALIPQCFMALHDRRALVAAAVVNVLPVVGWAVMWRPEGTLLFFNCVSAAVTLVFSMVFGLWIMRIIGQSEERAALIAELDASREENARLSAERGALAERERMSREIHDTLAQGFTSVLMLIQAVDAELEHDAAGARRHLDLMARTARHNLAEARALVAGRAPADLDGGSLPDALRRLGARHDAQVDITGEARPLPPGVEVVALRACQEALANVRKHAGSGAGVWVRLAYTEGSVTLRVRDSGRGFDLGLPQQGFGLPGLRTRAAEVGGTAEVLGAPGEGVTVVVQLPLPATAVEGSRA